MQPCNLMQAWHEFDQKMVGAVIAPNTSQLILCRTSASFLHNFCSYMIHCKPYFSL